MKTVFIEKMKFIDYLIESAKPTYKVKELDEDEILDLIKTKCSKMDINKPFWRGMRGESSGFILKGSNGSRKSINTSNHYTIILDHMIKEHGKSDYPLRSKSVIFINNDGMSETDKFGPSTYAIFPFDTTTVGIVPSDDIWNVKVRATRGDRTFINFNSAMEGDEIDDSSYQNIVKGIENSIDESGVQKFFKDGDNVEEKLKTLFWDDAGFKFGDSTLVNKESHAVELWASEEMIAVKMEVWKRLVKKEA